MNPVQFLLVVMLGNFPGGDVNIFQFETQSDCMMAAQVVAGATEQPINEFCYDTLNKRVITEIAKGPSNPIWSPNVDGKAPYPEVKHD